MKKRIFAMLAVLVTLAMTAAVYATVGTPSEGMPGVGNSARDGFAAGEEGTGEDMLPEEGVPGNQTGTNTGDEAGVINDQAERGIGWGGVVIAILVVAAIIAVVVCLIPKRRRN